MHRGRPCRAWILLFLALLLLQAWRLVAVPHGLASTWTRSRAETAVVPTGGRGVAQEFAMGADGLDGVWVRTAPAEDKAPVGQVVVTLAELGPSGPVPLLRQVHDAARFGAGAPVHLAFPEIHASRGRRYLLTVTHVSAGDGPPVRLRARLDDAHPAGSFRVDGDERWGDLLFETSAARATLPYRRDEVLAPLPGWACSWWTVAGGLLLFNGLLMAACRRVAGAAAAYATPGRVAAPASAPRAARCAAGMPAETAGRALALLPGTARRASLLAVVLLVVAGGVVAAWPVPDLRTIDLIARLPVAEIETTTGDLHQGVAVQPVALHGRVYLAIVALPTSRLVWRLHLPRGALLVGGVAMRPDVWTSPSDGANLRISLTGPDGATSTLATYTLVPFQIAEHRQRHAFRLSLDQWAGQHVTLTLETDPERWGNAVNDVPVWLEPRIVWPRGAQWGEGSVEGRE